MAPDRRLQLDLRGGSAGCDGASLALACLRSAGLGEGHTILVYGASGSVGTAAVQLAKHLGACVTAVQNEESSLSVRSAPTRYWTTCRRTSPKTSPPGRRPDLRRGRRPAFAQRSTNSMWVSAPGASTYIPAEGAGTHDRSAACRCGRRRAVAHMPPCDQTPSGERRREVRIVRRVDSLETIVTKWYVWLVGGTEPSTDRK